MIFDMQSISLVDMQIIFETYALRFLTCVLPGRWSPRGLSFRWKRCGGAAGTVAARKSFSGVCGVFALGMRLGAGCAFRK